jgi:hypothetical protein
MPSIEVEMLALSGEEEVADRVDKFCFAVADVLRRLLNLSPVEDEAGGITKKGMSDD